MALYDDPMLYGQGLLDALAASTRVGEKFPHQVVVAVDYDSDYEKMIQKFSNVASRICIKQHWKRYDSRMINHTKFCFKHKDKAMLFKLSVDASEFSGGTVTYMDAS